MAAGMDHAIEGPDGTSDEVEIFDDLARLTITAELAPGRPLRIVKFLAYGWSAERSMPAMRDQISAARAGAAKRGWDGLVEEQRAYLDEFWDGRTSSSRGMPSSNRRSASRFFMSCRLEREESRGRSQPRG